MRKVLIVEDQIIVASDIAQRLEKNGFSVTEMVTSGEDALTSISAHAPDIVLMDIQLDGELNGIQTADEVRKTFDLPVIFITAYGDAETLKAAKITRPFGYLLKPVKDSELFTNIELALHNHWFEKILRNREQWLATVLGSIGDGVIATDINGRINFLNPVAETFLGMHSLELVGRQLSETLPLEVEPPDTLPGLLARALRGEQVDNGQMDYILTARGGEQRYVNCSGRPLADRDGQPLGGVFVFKDVTERHRHEAERDHLISDLRKALDEVRTLQGLIPICANCKKIRDDEGYWQSIEDYFSQHSDTKFTHGLCPDCLKKIYPEYAEEILNAKETD